MNALLRLFTKHPQEEDWQARYDSAMTLLNTELASHATAQQELQGVQERLQTCMASIEQQQTGLLATQKQLETVTAEYNAVLISHMALQVQHEAALRAIATLENEVARLNHKKLPNRTES